MYFREDKTIVALSSAPGVSGIAVVRMSGADAGPIAARVFKEGRKKNPFYQGPSHTIHYGWIVNAAGERVDEVLLMWMKGPGTYTGEDTVEINCHGGPYVSRQVIETLVEAGAVLAEPGEYSRRAFLNGKMDLTKAEAVMDVINAETSLSLRASVSSLRGSLAAKIEELRSALLDLLTETEVNIDYPEYDVPEVSVGRMVDVCERVLAEARNLYKTSDAGIILKNGVKTAIVGAPNVGKSSLLNRLSGRDRAIVTDIPGTTRDTLEESVDLGGVPLRIIDTAGIHETSDTVEAIGVERAKAALAESDLVLFVIDSSRPLTEEEDGLFSLLGDKPFLILLNKSDNASLTADDVCARLCKKETDGAACPEVARQNSADAVCQGLADKILSVSAKDGTGLKELSARISDLFLRGIAINDHTPLISNMRQKEALGRAINALGRVVEAGRAGFAIDLLATDLHEAYDALGELSGHSVDSDLSDAVFSRFCLGK